MLQLLQMVYSNEPLYFKIAFCIACSYDAKLRSLYPSAAIHPLEFSASLGFR